MLAEFGVQLRLGVAGLLLVTLDGIAMPHLDFLESVIGGSFVETHSVLPDGSAVILRTRNEKTRFSRSLHTKVTSADCRLALVGPASIGGGTVKIDLADPIQPIGTAERLAKAVLARLWNVQIPEAERVDTDQRIAQVAEEAVGTWSTSRSVNADGTASLELAAPVLSGSRGDVVLSISDLRTRSVGYWGWFITGRLVCPRGGDKQAHIMFQLDGWDDLNRIVAVSLAAMQQIWHCDPLAR